MTSKNIFALICLILLQTSCIDSYHASSSDMSTSLFGDGKYSIENCVINSFSNINSYKYVLIDNDWSISGWNYNTPSNILYTNLFEELGLKVISISEYLKFSFNEKLKTVKSNSFYEEIPIANITADELDIYLTNVFDESVINITAPFNKKHPERSLSLFSSILKQYYTGYDSTKNISLFSDDKNRNIHDISEKQLVEYLNENKAEDIEGIWEGTLHEKKSYRLISKNHYLYKVGIIKSNNESEYINKYHGVVLYSENLNWSPKMIKFNFEQTSIKGMYSLNFSTGRLWTSENGTAILKNNSILEIIPSNNEVESITLIKKYPLNYANKGDNSTTISSGSGLLFSENGLISTNHHVINGAKTINIRLPNINKNYKADIIFQDKNNDIALLKIPDFDFSIINRAVIPFTIVPSNNTKSGQTVYTLGYPLGDMLGKSIKYSSGEINSIYGFGDDPRVFQISNPIQPGNSGGGLFNEDGELIGIVFSSLNAKYFFENADIIPQNVNFAIKGNYLLNLISLLPEYDDIMSRENTLVGLSIQQQIEMLEPFVVNIKVEK